MAGKGNASLEEVIRTQNEVIQEQSERISALTDEVEGLKKRLESGEETEIEKEDVTPGESLFLAIYRAKTEVYEESVKLVESPIERTAMALPELKRRRTAVSLALAGLTFKMATACEQRMDRGEELTAKKKDILVAEVTALGHRLARMLTEKYTYFAVTRGGSSGFSVNMFDEDLQLIVRWIEAVAAKDA